MPLYFQFDAVASGVLILEAEPGLVDEYLEKELSQKLKKGKIKNCVF